MKLEKYSMGMGDRFGHQAEAQLQACVLAKENGVVVTPVWNKSQREHAIIGSAPSSTRKAADAAVQALGWKHPYHVDADHVRLDTLEPFLPHSDYFTLDVGDAIGQPISKDAVAELVDRHQELVEPLRLPGLDAPLRIDKSEFENAARKYLPAVQAAERIYRRIAGVKGAGNFITEISMDETDTAQAPWELLVILAALADAGVEAQAIAPKFIGRFNKGVDYVGEVSRFATQFSECLAVVGFAVKQYPLPPALKLSVHSGSDKFSLYDSMSAALERSDAGLHLKTAGTTWLQELAGLAETGSEGCVLVREIYSQALERMDELCAPYACVIDIDRKALPPRREVTQWSSEQWVSALAHNCQNPNFNPHLRQLLHVGYKIAAEMGTLYLDALRRHKNYIGAKVTANLYENHLRPLFVRGSRSAEAGKD